MQTVNEIRLEKRWKACNQYFNELARKMNKLKAKRNLHL